MTMCVLGSRSRRAAVVGLLCVCAAAAHVNLALAQEQEVVVGDQFSSVGVAISDDAIGSTISDDGMPCDGGYDCDGNCDACTPCDSCEPCGNERRCSGWFGAEYLRWRLDSGNHLPPLLSAGPSNVPLADVAKLGEPSTVILSGHDTVNDDWRDGYRFYGGFWLDCCHTCGVGADYFDIGGDDYNYTSPQDTIIVGRPFYNTELNEQDVQLVSVPNELDGTAQVRSNDDFKGAGLTINRSLWRGCNPCCPGITAGLTLLGGYRHYDYDSNLSVTERLTVLPGTSTALVPGTTFLVQDRFRTENEFNGGEIGLQAYKQRCWWWLDGMAKVALGSQRSTVRINGLTVIDVPGGGTSVAQGGLLSSEVTNIGRYSESDFAVIPEFRLGVGACVTKCCSVRAGYNVILWGDLARAGSQLPPGLQVDPRNLPPVVSGGGNEPEFHGVRGSQLVAHGLDASVQWQW
jgi:Putative beta barrel porin-7 (BBP7)